MRMVSGMHACFVIRFIVLTTLSVCSRSHSPTDKIISYVYTCFETALYMQLYNHFFPFIKFIWVVLLFDVVVGAVEAHIHIIQIAGVFQEFRKIHATHLAYTTNVSVC